MGAYFRICLLGALFYDGALMLEAEFVQALNQPALQNRLLFGYEAIEHIGEPIPVRRRNAVQAQYQAHQQQNFPNNPSVFQHYRPQNIQNHPQNNLALYGMPENGNFQAIFNRRIAARVTQARNAAALAIQRLNSGIEVRFADFQQIYNIAIRNPGFENLQLIPGVQFDYDYVERALAGGGYTTCLAKSLIALRLAPGLNNLIRRAGVLVRHHRLNFLVLHAPSDLRVSKNVKELALNCIATNRAAGVLRFDDQAQAPNVQVPVPAYVTLHQQFLTIFNLQEEAIEGLAPPPPLQERSVGSVRSYYSTQRE